MTLHDVFWLLLGSVLGVALALAVSALWQLPRKATHRNPAVKRDDGRFVLAKELRKKQFKAARA